jgi:hypothetical protein
LSAFLALSWGSQPCQASALWAREACGVHLAEVLLPVSRHEPCHDTRSECVGDTGCVLRLARPVVARAALACSVLWLDHSKPSAHRVHHRACCY